MLYSNEHKKIQLKLGGEHFFRDHVLLIKLAMVIHIPFNSKIQGMHP